MVGAKTNQDVVKKRTEIAALTCHFYGRCVSQAQLFCRCKMLYGHSYTHTFCSLRGTDWKVLLQGLLVVPSAMAAAAAANERARTVTPAKR